LLPHLKVRKTSGKKGKRIMTHYSTITAQDVIVNEGLFVGTTIMTLAGEKAVEDLKAGDRVITRSGARAIRSLRSMMLPTAKMVCISASALGVDQPAADMHVAFDQGINIRDWRAKALKGVAQAVIPAKDLMDGEYIRAETLVAACVYALHFDQPEVIYANGIEVFCTPATVTA